MINSSPKLNYARVHVHPHPPPPGLSSFDRLLYTAAGPAPRSCRADAEEVEEGQRHLVVGACLAVARRRRRRGEGGARARRERRGARDHVVA